MESGWMALEERSMSMEQGRLNALDRRRWQFIVRSEWLQNSVYLYVLASCGGVYTPLHGVGLGLAGNVNSIIEEEYLGTDCGLTRAQGILGVWGFITGS